MLKYFKLPKNEKSFSVIEGNIGSGKSTKLKEIEEICKNNTQIEFLQQPVHEWTYLKPYYENPKDYAYLLQEQIVNSYTRAYYNSNAQHVIMESCSYTALHVFTESLYSQNIFCHKDYERVSKLEAINLKPHMMLYLDTRPEVCLDRIRHRKRPGEENITLPYLKSLESYFDKMIDNADFPCIRIDNNNIVLS